MLFPVSVVFFSGAGDELVEVRSALFGSRFGDRACLGFVVSVRWRIRRLFSFWMLLRLWVVRQRGERIEVLFPSAAANDELRSGSGSARGASPADGLLPSSSTAAHLKAFVRCGALRSEVVRVAPLTSATGGSTAAPGGVGVCGCF